jgi:hypothetical protein
MAIGMRIMTADRLRHYRKVRAAKGRLCCERCQRNIHRHDRYVIVAVQHKVCSDPKMVGQQSFGEIG